MNKAERRARDLEHRKETIPKLPEGFEIWARKELFHRFVYIFYRRRGSYADFFCSGCGNSYRQKIKRSEGYMGQFEKVVDPPVHNMSCRCIVCDAEGCFKADGKMKDSGVWSKRRKCYIAQKYEDGIVVRYFEIEKMLRKNEAESYNLIEIARNFFLPKSRTVKDYHLMSSWNGTADWYNHNIGGMYNIVLEEGCIYPGSYKEMEGTIFAYTGIKEYIREKDVVKMARYLETYKRCPYLEIFVKMKLYDLAEYLINNEGRCTDTVVRDSGALRPADLMGIYPERMKLLIRERGNIRMLKLMQLERRRENRWKEEMLMEFFNLNFEAEDLDSAMQYMSARRFLNRVEKYAGVRYQEGLCGKAVGRLAETAGRYLDYLRMREERGYDLNNSVFLYPRDLQAAHAQMVTETNEARLKEKSEQDEKMFPNISEKYEKLHKRYHYESDGLCIRPARSVDEIIREGQILHHCVGNSTYLEKHNRGESFILFLRKTDAPDIPYITVEIRQERIVQWYGQFDKKPDREENERWLEAYTEHLKRKIKRCEEITKMPLVMEAG